jgi:hypothetical protein
MHGVLVVSTLAAIAWGFFRRPADYDRPRPAPKPEEAPVTRLTYRGQPVELLADYATGERIVAKCRPRGAGYARVRFEDGRERTLRRDLFAVEVVAS